MSNLFRKNQPEQAPLPSLLTNDFPPLPEYLARRVLRLDEDITWVRGPRFTPDWECYVTHPALFLVALMLGVLLIFSARLAAPSWAKTHPAPFLVAGALVLGSIYVLAFFNGYFTRLVVTTKRVFIMQGFEIRRTWSLDRLPRSLVRYTRRSDGREERAVDIDSLRDMLGGANMLFSDSKTIRAFGKQVDQIRRLENDRG